MRSAEVIIRIDGLRVLRDGSLAVKRDVPQAGKYLAEYDASKNGFHGLIVVTEKREEAMRLPGADYAQQVIQRQSRTTPRRPDGTVNRPLAAYAVTLLPVGEL